MAEGEPDCVGPHGPWREGGRERVFPLVCFDFLSLCVYLIHIFLLCF